MKERTSTTSRPAGTGARQRFGFLSWRWGTLVLDRAFGFAIGIVLARWSGVEVYGEYVLVASIIATLINVSDFGLTPSLLINPDQAERSVAPIARLKILLGLLFLVCGLSLAFLNAGRPSVLMIGLVFASEGILNVARIYQTAMMAEGEFRRGFVLTSIARLAQSAVVLVAAFVWPSAQAVLLSMMVFGIILLSLFASKYFKISPSQNSLSLKTLVTSQGNLAFNQVLVHVSDRFDAMLLGYMLAPSAVGLYGAAYLFFRNSKIFSAAISSVYLPEFSRIHRRNDFERMMRSYSEAVGVGLGIGMPLALVLGFGASDIMRLVFGSQFNEASLVLTILAPGIPIMFLGTIMANLLNGTGDSRTPLRAAAIAAGANIVGNLIWTPQYGMVSASLLTVGAEVINLILMLPAILRIRRKALDATSA